MAPKMFFLSAFLTVVGANYVQAEDIPVTNPAPLEKPNAAPTAPCNASKDVQASISGDRLLISVNRNVDLEMSLGIRRALKMMTPVTKEIVLTIRSGGGMVMEGNRIIKWLKAKRADGIRLTTVVPNGAICASMCVPIFMQGEVRQAGPAASFMFHSVHFMLGVRVNMSWKNEDIFRTFIEAGMKSEWLERNKTAGVFDSPQFTWYSGGELMQENSGVVTELLARQDKMKSLDILGQKIWFGFGSQPDLPVSIDKL